MTQEEEIAHLNKRLSEVLERLNEVLEQLSKAQERESQHLEQVSAMQAENHAAPRAVGSGSQTHRGAGEAKDAPATVHQSQCGQTPSRSQARAEEARSQAQSRTEA